MPEVLSSRCDWDLYQYHFKLRKLLERIKHLSERSIEIINRRILDDDLNLITHEHHVIESTKK